MTQCEHSAISRCGLCLQRDEIERLMAALKQIAEYPQGQVYSAGFAPDDAEAMQEIARKTLIEQVAMSVVSGPPDETAKGR